MSAVLFGPSEKHDVGTLRHADVAGVLHRDGELVNVIKHRYGRESGVVTKAQWLELVDKTIAIREAAR